jgi:hypothetical protein
MRDWVGNAKSTFTTLGASSHSKHEREENDYYATDPKTVAPLFERETFSKDIWEPACGEGHLSEAIKRLGKDVISTDKYPRGYGGCGVDFLKQLSGYGCDIITNPPYKYAQEFVEKALELSGNKVAMFLKLTFLEGQKRKKLFEKYPPKVIYVFSRRQKCAINGKFEETESSAAAYAWFVWKKGYTGEPIIRWI